MPDTKRDWVDFRLIRGTIDFARVLESYGVTLKLRSGGVQHQGFCPLPTHEGTGRSPSFSAHLGKKAFHCFGCQAKGNVLDFAARMEGWNPDDPQDIRKTASLMQKRFLGGEVERTPPAQKERNVRRGTRSTRKAYEVKSADPKAKPLKETTADTLPRIVNAPLDFELKNLDAAHPYLAGRGLTPETIRKFGLGFCSRGLMADRIAIPLHDTAGQLIGYGGRMVDDDLVTEENSKYLLPGPRERPDRIFEFSKSLFLYNGHRIQAPVMDLIVVEGFFSIFHLHQCGFENVVALMGNSCSDEQRNLIVRLSTETGRIWLMTDGDKGGRDCAAELLTKLSPHRSVRWIPFEEGKDPCDYSRKELENFLSFSLSSPVAPVEDDLEHIQMVSLRLVREKVLPFEPQSVQGSEAVYDLFRQLAEDLDREALWVLCFDVRNQATCLSQVSLGTINATPAHPRDILKIALMANSMSLILVHNHPSGDPSPSPEDRTITTEIVSAAKVVGIKVLDHLIVGNGAFYSFHDHGGL